MKSAWNFGECPLACSSSETRTYPTASGGGTIATPRRLRYMNLSFKGGRTVASQWPPPAQWTDLSIPSPKASRYVPEGMPAPPPRPIQRFEKERYLLVQGFSYTRGRILGVLKAFQRVPSSAP